MGEAFRWAPTVVSLITLVFGFGLFYQRVQELERRVVVLEERAEGSEEKVLTVQIDNLSARMDDLGKRFDRLSELVIRSIPAQGQVGRVG